MSQEDWPSTLVFFTIWKYREKYYFQKSCVFIFQQFFCLSILCWVWKCPLSSQLVCFLNKIFQYNDTRDKFVSKYYCDTFILRRGNKRRQNVTGLLCRHRVKRRHTLYVLSPSSLSLALKQLYKAGESLHLDNWVWRRYVTFASNSLSLSISFTVIEEDVSNKIELSKSNALPLCKKKYVLLCVWLSATHGQ